MDERDQTPDVDWAVDYSVATVGQLVAGRDHHAQLADGLGREHPTVVALAVPCVDLVPCDAVVELLAVGVLELPLQVDLGERAEVGLLGPEQLVPAGSAGCGRGRRAGRRCRAALAGDDAAGG
jgi:hypothetical protein